MEAEFAEVYYSEVYVFEYNKLRSGLWCQKWS